MTRTTPILAVLLGLALAVPAVAQETPAAPAPAADPVPNPDDLSLGREENADGIGSNYTAATHGDWEIRCLRAEDGSDPCQLYQLLKDAEGNPISEFTMVNLPAGQQAAAGATAIVPLETLLTQELSLQVDGGAVKKYPFAWCSPIGCIARIGFTQPEIDAMKRGNRVNVTIVPVVAPEQKVTVAMSLRGFTAGYDALVSGNIPKQPAVTAEPAPAAAPGGN
ncbi:MAG: invasion associated locus B family protein [Paracoccaceae bacterium]|nr:MAG: invasion associated locus B family protein [Paracoccaceae bacterium]